jgi:hypothetical protein
VVAAAVVAEAVVAAAVVAAAVVAEAVVAEAVVAAAVVAAAVVVTLDPKAIPGIGIVIPAVDEPLKFWVGVNLRVAVEVAPFAVLLRSRVALACTRDPHCKTMSKAKVAIVAATFMIVNNHIHNRWASLFEGHVQAWLHRTAIAQCLVLLRQMMLPHNNVAGGWSWGGQRQVLRSWPDRWWRPKINSTPVTQYAGTVNG